MYDNAEEVSRGLTRILDEVKSGFSSRDDALREHGLRLQDVEQRIARRGGGASGNEIKGWGSRVVESPEFKALASSASQRGTARVGFETKTILSAASSWGTGVSPSSSLVMADRQPIVALPHRPLVIRDLLAVSPTTSNAIEYPVQTAFTNNAAVVAENTLKPQSDLGFDLKSAPVRTVAHTMKASRQILDDAPQLQSFIDTEMRYGVSFAEEAEILNGDGTGQHLLGIVPQASAYSAAFSITGETAIDRVALALNQVELALYEADGIVLHPTDYRRILLTKDGMGRYIVGDPLGQNNLLVLWGVPVAKSLSIPQGTFLAGSFRRGAKLYDRLAVEVLISTEDGDNFSRNLITVRAEERVALTVQRPASFVTGALPT